MSNPKGASRGSRPSDTVLRNYQGVVRQYPFHSINVRADVVQKNRVAGNSYHGVANGPSPESLHPRRTYSEGVKAQSRRQNDNGRAQVDGFMIPGS